MGTGSRKETCMSFLKHWRFLLLTLLAIGALGAFAACGDNNEGGGGSGGASGSAAAGERQQGGKMTVQSNEFESMDPHYSSFAQDIALERMLWRGLYHLSIDNKPEPAMAADKPETSADAKTFTVKL